MCKNVLLVLNVLIREVQRKLKGQELAMKKTKIQQLRILDLVEIFGIVSY